MVLLMSYALNCSQSSEDVQSLYATPSQKRLAEITEMIHTASLFHDDVIDKVRPNTILSLSEYLIHSKLPRRPRRGEEHHRSIKYSEISWRFWGETFYYLGHRFIWLVSETSRQVFCLLYGSKCVHELAATLHSAWRSPRI